MTACSRCGTNLPANARFCSGCGAPAPAAPGVKTLGAPIRAPLMSRSQGMSISKRYRLFEIPVVLAVIGAAAACGAIGLLALLGVVWIYSFVEGFQNKVVLFYDARDTLVAFGAIAALFCGFSWPLFYVISALFAGVSLRWSIRHNQSIWIGSTVTLFKISFGFAWIAQVLTQLSRASDAKRRSADRFLGLVLLGLLAALIVRTINGKEVYAKRGWVAP